MERPKEIPWCLESLRNLQEQNDGMLNKLTKVHAPTHVGTYIKPTFFDGSLFAKFINALARGTSVALMRDVGIKIREKHV